MMLITEFQNKYIFNINLLFKWKLLNSDKYLTPKKEKTGEKKKEWIFCFYLLIAAETESTTKAETILEFEK